MDAEGGRATEHPVKWPSGHVGWLYSGRSSFEGAVGRFFAEGAARGERLLLVVDDPVPGQWPTHLVERGALLITSVGEIYGPERTVHAATQRSVFATTLAEALADGFSGIRVAADNTSLVDTPPRLRAWLEWERVADRFIAENPVTGLCAFDRTRLDPRTIAGAVDAHHVMHPEAAA